MAFFTKRTTINLINECDLEDVRNLHNEDTVLSQLSDMTYVTKEMQDLWFENLSKSSKSFRYVCRSIVDGELIGVFRVDNMDAINKSVMVGLDIALEYRRKGYATEVYEFFINYFFETKSFHRLYLSTLESNFAGQSLYLNLGFVLEGVQKEAIWRNGAYINLLNYSLVSEV
jgi:RimJ/RimL family protein N-acetyltransferase